jgi:uncharacterized Zn-finger protein
VCEVEGCPSTFLRKSHLERHQLCVHADDTAKAHICPVAECGKLFSLPHQLKRHAKVHQQETSTPPSPKPSEFRCLQCEGVVYKLEKNLKQHQKLEHSAQTFVCGVSECQFTTYKWSLLMAHKLESHPLKRPLEDVVEDTTDSPELEAKSFQCTVDGCQKAFTRKHALKVHVKTVHEDSRPFECRLCQSAFGHKHLLNRHLERMHGEDQ